MPEFKALQNSVFGVVGSAVVDMLSGGEKNEELSTPTITDEDTGVIREEEASRIAKLKAYRAGVLFTSTTGTGTEPTTSSAKLR